jgi:hypothetical protein
VLLTRNVVGNVCARYLCGASRAANDATVMVVNDCVMRGVSWLARRSSKCLSRHKLLLPTGCPISYSTVHLLDLLFRSLAVTPSRK